MKSSDAQTEIENSQRDTAKKYSGKNLIIFNTSKGKFAASPNVHQQTEPLTFYPAMFSWQARRVGVLGIRPAPSARMMGIKMKETMTMAMKMKMAKMKMKMMTSMKMRMRMKMTMRMEMEI